MAFELASTNLVLELSIVMVVILGWQFAVAELLGAPVMVLFLALLFRRFLSSGLVAEAREQAERGIRGRMEGHAEMHMEVTEGKLWHRIWSEQGRTAISHYFVMDWLSVWPDVAGGLLIAGALAAWVPRTFWQGFFLTSHPLLATLWGPVVGPLVAVLSFVCSVGNIPLAAVLWNGGISFGGLIAFIFADLIVLPILDIYRKYYGWRMMWFILATFYVAMSAAALLVELVFGGLGLVPAERHAAIAETAITLNYTTILNLLFLLVAGALVYRFLRTGGVGMVRMMNQSPAVHHMSHHDHHDGHGHVHQ
jgi:uncharacterized membrane protein YraQ (UPF0718 family)